MAHKNIVNIVHHRNCSGTCLTIDVIKVVGRRQVGFQQWLCHSMEG